MNIYIHKYIVLKAIVHWRILLSFTKFSMYQISPNNCYLSSSDFYLGWKPKSRGRGGTLNAEVIGMLVGNVLENPKKYPNCWRNTLKNTNFTENFLETSHFYSIWKMSKPKNTRISFLHKTFQKTLKIPESEFYALKIRRAYLSLCHGNTTPGGQY